jgi:hypothetical protein
MKKHKTAKTIGKTPAYLAWVEEVRQYLAEVNKSVVRWYHVVHAGEKKQIHKQGGYQSFDLCVEREFGIDAKRWGHLKMVIERFGETVIERYGYEASVTLLRLAPKSEQERSVFEQIETWTMERGHPPSPETVQNEVRKAVGSQGPTKSYETESDRLRAKLIEAERTIATLRDQLAAEKTCRRAAEDELRKFRSKRRTEPRASV